METLKSVILCMGTSPLSLCILAELRTHVMPNFICVCNLVIRCKWDHISDHISGMSISPCV